MEGHFLESVVSKMFLLRKSIIRLQFICPICKFKNINILGNVTWKCSVMLHCNCSSQHHNSGRANLWGRNRTKDIVLHIMWNIFSYGDSYFREINTTILSRIYFDLINLWSLVSTFVDGWDVCVWGEVTNMEDKMSGKGGRLGLAAQIPIEWL